MPLQHWLILAASFVGFIVMAGLLAKPCEPGAAGISVGSMLVAGCKPARARD